MCFASALKAKLLLTENALHVCQPSCPRFVHSVAGFADFGRICCREAVNHAIQNGIGHISHDEVGQCYLQQRSTEFRHTEHIELTLTAPDTVQHRNNYDLGKHTEQLDMCLRTPAVRFESRANALLKPVTIGKHGSGISEITKGMSEDCGWSQVSRALTYPERRWYEWWHNIHHGRNNCLHKSCAHSQGLRTKRLADNSFDIMLSVPVWRHTKLTIGATAPPALGLAAALPRLYILAHGT